MFIDKVWFNALTKNETFVDGMTHNDITYGAYSFIKVTVLQSKFRAIFRIIQAGFSRLLLETSFFFINFVMMKRSLSCKS